jgi:hypothetical protein
MEAQAPTRSTTSELEKKAWWLSLRGIFSSTRKSSYLFVLFSAAVGNGGFKRGELLTAAWERMTSAFPVDNALWGMSNNDERPSIVCIACIFLVLRHTLYLF